MRIGLFGGVILASPMVLYQIWAFIQPALTSKERNWALPIVGALVVLFVGGVVFGYLTLPRGLEFLLQIFPDVETNLRLGDYYSFTLRFLLALGSPSSSPSSCSQRPPPGSSPPSSSPRAGVGPS